MSNLEKPFADVIRLIIIGDVHKAWDPVQDAAALSFLRPDAALFVGDFGEEAVQLVQQIASLSVPKAVVLGNHDAWGPLYLGNGYSRLNMQLELLGSSHVGYHSRHFKAAGGAEFSVVGGRPFSDGNATLDGCVEHLYGVTSQEESAQKIAQQIHSVPEGNTLILMAHNGPSGLGSKRHDPCGLDFRAHEGDYGDSDLRGALSLAKAEGRHVPLVVFGHMHHRLNSRFGRGLRNMAHIDQNTGTVFLDAAVVPRAQKLSGSGQRASHFVVVTLKNGIVMEADNVWVVGSQPEECKVWKSERLLTSKADSVGNVVRQVYRAFDDSWTEGIVTATARQKGADEMHGEYEL